MLGPRSWVAVAAVAACGVASSVSCGESGGEPDSSLDAGADVEGFDAASPDSGPLDDSSVAPLVVGVIGDYGVCSDADPDQYVTGCPHEQGVAALVHGWSPLAIVTTGDNSYGSGTYAQVPGDQAPYDDYIDAGRFFPTMGNHDWLSAAGDAPSLAYFHLASAFYAKSFGSLVTFYVLDTNYQDDAGDTANSAQAAWLRAQLAASATTWNVVVNHQAPYSSCGEFSYDGTGGRPDFRWIAATRADLVLSGHSHVYERLAEASYDDSGVIPYVVVGTSGAPLQGNCGIVLPGQQKAIYGAYGALRVEVTATKLVVTFTNEDGGVGDTLTLTK